jgi:hypothetical protein
VKPNSGVEIKIENSSQKAIMISKKNADFLRWAKWETDNILKT